MPARRLRAAVLLLVLAGVTAVLLLSDRAQGWYRSARDAAFDGAARLRDRFGLGDATRDDIPLAAGTAGHIALFLIATVVVGFVFRRRLQPATAAITTFAASAAFEVLQDVLSATRSAQIDDLGANAIGVLLGLVVLVVLQRVGRIWRSRSLAW